MTNIALNEAFNPEFAKELKYGIIIYKTMH